MDNVVVANPRAAAGRVRAWWDVHRGAIEASLGSVEVRFTEGPRHATVIAREAIRAGCGRVIAVGGDGTVNEVVNGFFDTEGPIRDDVSLVVYPGGTGGDFVRSIGMADIEIEEALERAETRRVDVGRVVLTRPGGEEATEYFVNISSFGASGLIVDKVNRSTKMFGGKASFYLGTVRGLLAYRNQRVRMRIDDGPEQELVFNTAAIANGRYFGGSMKVAPEAIVDDGLFDIVVIGDVGVVTFVRKSKLIYQGRHLREDWVRAYRGRKVEVVPLGSDPVLIDLDGEQPGRLPARYEILPAAIQILAPWGRAEAVHSG